MNPLLPPTMGHLSPDCLHEGVSSRPPFSSLRPLARTYLWIQKPKKLCVSGNHHQRPKQRALRRMEGNNTSGFHDERGRTKRRERNTMQRVSAAAGLLGKGLTGSIDESCGICWPGISGYYTITDSVWYVRRLGKRAGTVMRQSFTWP